MGFSIQEFPNGEENALSEQDFKRACLQLAFWEGERASLDTQAVNEGEEELRSSHKFILDKLIETAREHLQRLSLQQNIL